MERARIAGEIVAREQEASGRPFDAAFLEQMRGNLANLSLEQLAEVQQRASGLLPIPNLPGATQADLVYTPVTPCRIIDTRLAGGPIAAGTTRNFFAAGSGFASQGGVAGSCGVPLGPATAAVINLVAVGPAGAGDLRITPFGTPIPVASIINYSSGLNLANGPAVTICNPATTTCTFDITIQADVSATNLVADVQGFFAVPSCQGGTVKALGECFETATRTAGSVFAASDTCKAAGGRLATGLELRSLRGGAPLTLDATGEWTDSVYINGSAFTAMIVADGGGFSQSSTVTAHPFRCVYRPLS
jgi:hypothetical protein